MRFRLTVHTPPGQASKAQSKVQMMVLKFKKPTEVMVNDDDSELTFIIDGTFKQYTKMVKNVAVMQTLMKKAMNNRVVRHYLKKKATLAQRKQLDEWLTKDTEMVIEKMEDE